MISNFRFNYIRLILSSVTSISSNKCVPLTSSVILLSISSSLLSSESSDRLPTLPAKPLFQALFPTPPVKPLFHALFPTPPVKPLFHARLPTPPVNPLFHARLPTPPVNPLFHPRFPEY